MKEAIINAAPKIHQYRGIHTANENTKGLEVENQITEALHVTAESLSQSTASEIHEKANGNELSDTAEVAIRMPEMKVEELATHQMANTKKGKIRTVDEDMITTFNPWRRRSAALEPVLLKTLFPPLPSPSVASTQPSAAHVNNKASPAWSQSKFLKANGVQIPVTCVELLSFPQYSKNPITPPPTGLDHPLLFVNNRVIGPSNLPNI